MSAHLGAQLPLLVRGTYYDRWRPSGQAATMRSLDEFLQPITEELDQLRPVNVRDATRCLFRVLSRHADRGQLEKVRGALPEDVRRLWSEDFLAEAPSPGAAPEE